MIPCCREKGRQGRAGTGILLIQSKWRLIGWYPRYQTGLTQLGKMLTVIIFYILSMDPTELENSVLTGSWLGGQGE